MQQPTTPPHPPLNTVSHRRKRVVTSLRHAGVSVRGSGGQQGIVDTLLPYVQPGCSASAGLLKHRLPPRFLTRVYRQMGWGDPARSAYCFGFCQHNPEPDS